MNAKYHEKYLKYKQKYIDLQKIIGGSKKTAQKYFQDAFTKNIDNIISILSKDINLLRDKDLIKKESEIIFNKIYDYLNENKIYQNGKELDINKYIDWIIKSYVSRSFGNPNSLENYGRFKEAIQKYEILANKKKSNPTEDNIEYYSAIQELKLSFKQLDEIEGLIELERFIDYNEFILKVIEEEEHEKHKKKEEQKLLKQRGEKDVSIILDTDKIIIYNPNSENGSKYYGRNTRWCTAANENCQFNNYSESGPLYIIQSKEDPKHKYQLHIQLKQVMDIHDEPVSIKDIKLYFNDPELDSWFDSKLKDIQDKEEEEFFRQYKINQKIHIGAILMDLDDFFKKTPNLKSLSLMHNFNLKLKDYLLPLNKLKYLYLHNYIYEPFGDSLKNLTNLKILSIDSINYLFEDSLKTLTKLRALTIGRYNQAFGNSLENLTNLKILNIQGSDFNEPFGDSLNKLTNLKILKLGKVYNKSFENSLKNLVNLKILDLSYSIFNKPLGDSLNTLTKLETLLFGKSFDQPIDNCLQYLVNLKNLNVEFIIQNEILVVYAITTNLERKNYGFNKKWCLSNGDKKNCINDIIHNSVIKYDNNNEILFIQSSNQNNKIYLLDAFYNLVDNEKNNIIIDIDDLINEFNNEELNNWLPIYAKRRLGRHNSNTLIINKNIRKIIGDLKEYFDIVLEVSREPITSLIFDDEFNKPLGDSLNILSENLENINFGNSFNQPLEDSLSNLAKLKSINFGNSFDQPLGDSFKKLNKLQKYNFKPVTPDIFYSESHISSYDDDYDHYYDYYQYDSFLRVINFGNSFNQPIIDSLKELYLQSIIVGTAFNQPIGYFKSIIQKV